MHAGLIYSSTSIVVLLTNIIVPKVYEYGNCTAVVNKCMPEAERRKQKLLIFMAALHIV